MLSLVAISRAPLEKLEGYKARMGWSFRWVSSYGSDFNRDYQVSFTPEEQKTAVYNYKARVGSSEAPEVSVFVKGEDGQIFHTYSCYARGLDALNGAYQLLDLVPKGTRRAGPAPSDGVGASSRQIRELSWRGHSGGQTPRPESMILLKA